MKKFILSMVLITLFTACSNSVTVTSTEVADVYKKDFSVKVLAVFGENETEMTVTKNGMSIGILLNSPDELSGMGIEISDEHAKITYDGMEQEIEINSLPNGTPFLLLKELFEEISNPDEFVLSTENNCLTARGENFSVIISEDELLMTSAEFPTFETKFTFSEWNFGTSEQKI